MVPDNRIRMVNTRSIDRSQDYVLYVMTMFRRTRFNFALDRAIELSKKLRKPLVIFESLRAGYRWNCDRFHQFIVNGMVDNQKACQSSQVEYYPYVERETGDAKGLVEQLANRCCAIVTDDFPDFFIPQFIRWISKLAPVAVEAIDSNGILPIGATEKAFSRAHFFRIYLQRELRPYLLEFPEPDPLSRKLPQPDFDLTKIKKRWPPADLTDPVKRVQAASVDHSVPAISNSGGETRGREILKAFVDQDLSGYDDDRNYPEKSATSGLSPYLHFGHVSAHEVFQTIMDRQEWNPSRIAEQPTKKVNGWWGVPESCEAFLDQLITWRELGYNMAFHDENYHDFESLPEWARKTLAEHEDDKRDPCYDLAEFKTAETHDPLWNAAQTQLVREGTIHNYLRMLWGKKILHWSRSPREALAIMIELNNKYALDGRNPNSYSGIFWILGRYDRAWGPERPIFGKIRYMTSDNTARKFPVKGYIEKYHPENGTAP